MDRRTAAAAAILAALAACTVERAPGTSFNPVVAFREGAGVEFAECGILRYASDSRCPANRDEVIGCVATASETCAPVHWMVERAAGGFATIDHLFLVPVDGGRCETVSFSPASEAGCRFFLRTACATVAFPEGCGPPTPRDCGESVREGSGDCEPDDV